MSADNGIYILKTNTEAGSYEFRVAKLHHIEDIAWDHASSRVSSSPGIHIANARAMWEGSEVYSTYEDAGRKALEMLKEAFIKDEPVEYGIQKLYVPRVF